MDPMTLAIPLAFILLAAMLCWHVISAKGKWWLKLAFIIVVPSFGIAVWKAIDSYRGWPTPEATPDKALLVWAEVREPEPNAGTPGEIYLWLIPLEEREEAGWRFLDYRRPGGEPRAHKLPYTRETHEMVERAKAMIKAGKPVVIESSARGSLGEPGEDGTPPNGEETGTGTGGHEQVLRFYEMPPPAPPRKK